MNLPPPTALAHLPRRRIAECMRPMQFYFCSVILPQFKRPGPAPHPRVRTPAPVPYPHTNASAPQPPCPIHTPTRRYPRTRALSTHQRVRTPAPAPYPRISASRPHALSTLHVKRAQSINLGFARPKRRVDWQVDGTHVPQHRPSRRKRERQLHESWQRRRRRWRAMRDGSELRRIQKCAAIFFTRLKSEFLIFS